MSAPRLLAIETSGRTGSIALDAGGTVTERTIATPREQTAQILALVDELLAASGLVLADLDALVFGRGPGSFTGLRVAAAVVQGLSLASGVPIVAVSSLAALAQRGFQGRRVGAAGSGSGPSLRSGSGSGMGAGTDQSGVWTAPGRALCCVDARMGEVYWAGFRQAGGLAVAETSEHIGGPSAVEAPAGRFSGFGDGFAAYERALAPVIARAVSIDSSLEPGAPELLALAAADVEAGRFVSIAEAVPVYLREADAWRRE